MAAVYAPRASGDGEGFVAIEYGKTPSMLLLGDLAWAAFFGGLLWELVVVPWRR